MQQILMQTKGRFQSWNVLTQKSWNVKERKAKESQDVSLTLHLNSQSNCLAWKEKKGSDFTSYSWGQTIFLRKKRNRNQKSNLLQGVSPFSFEFLCKYFLLNIYTRSGEIFIFVILVEREGTAGKFEAVFLPLPSSSSWVLFAILFDFDLLFVAHSSRESTSAWGRKSKPLGVNGIYISFLFQHSVSHILVRRKGNKQTHAIYREKEFRVTTPTQKFQQQEKEGETFKSDKSLMSFNRNKSKRERERVM